MDSGLDDVMKYSFGSVKHYAKWKRSIHRFLWSVTEELLHSDLTQANTGRSDEESNAAKSSTTKLWVENLVKPVFIIGT